MEAWLIGLIVVGLIVLSASAFTLFMWRGVWLARNKGQMSARTRWHWYVIGERKMRQQRVRRQISQGKLPPPVLLEVQKSTHDQRARYIQEVEKARSEHGKVSE